MAWFSGLPALPHSTSLPCPGPLGRSSGDSASTKLQCGTAEQGWCSSSQQIWPPQDCSSDGGRGGTGAYTAGTCGGFCPTSNQRSTRSHWGTQLRRGPPPGLTSLLTARYSKAWLIYPGHSWALQINSVPSNYSMENRFWTNKKKCLS